MEREPDNTDPLSREAIQQRLDEIRAEYDYRPRLGARMATVALEGFEIVSSWRRPFSRRPDVSGVEFSDGE